MGQGRVGGLDKLALAGLAASAVALVLTATRWGSGASPDSAVYIGTAQNLLAGQGLTVPFGSTVDDPLVQFPPLYPLVLAGLGLAGVAPEAGARWLGAALLAANAALAGVLVGRNLGTGPWVHIAAASLLLISPSMVLLHAMAWSEPLFLLLGFAALLALARYLTQPSWGALGISAALVGLACLTRYAGAAFAVAGGLALLAWAPGKFWARAVHGVLWGAAGVIPTAGWMAYNAAAAGSATNRELVWHPIGGVQAQQALDTAAGWLMLPATAPASIRLSVLLAVAGGLAIVWSLNRRAGRNADAERERGPEWVSRLLAVFGVVYGGFLAVSISLIDANTPLDERILAPVYMAGLVIGVTQAAEWLRRPSLALWVRLGLLAVVALFGVAATTRSASLARQGYQEGIGFNHEAWRTSTLWAEVRKLSVDTTIYSNAPEAIFLHTGRSALRLPRQFSSANQRANDGYAREVARFEAALAAGAVVVDFSAVRGGVADRTNELKLEATVSTAEGRIYARGR